MNNSRVFRMTSKLLEYIILILYDLDYSFNLLIVWLFLFLSYCNKSLLFEMLGKENRKLSTKIPEDFNGDIEAYWYFNIYLVKFYMIIKRIANNPESILKQISLRRN